MHRAKEPAYSALAEIPPVTPDNYASRSLHFDFGDNTLYDANGTCTPSACLFKDHLVVDTAKVGVNYFLNSVYEQLK